MSIKQKILCEKKPVDLINNSKKIFRNYIRRTNELLTLKER